jgi:hypothetical protein
MVKPEPKTHEESTPEQANATQDGQIDLVKASELAHYNAVYDKVNGLIEPFREALYEVYRPSDQLGEQTIGMLAGALYLHDLANDPSLTSKALRQQRFDHYALRPTAWLEQKLASQMASPARTTALPIAHTLEALRGSVFAKRANFCRALLS